MGHCYMYKEPVEVGNNTAEVSQHNTKLNTETEREVYTDLKGQLTFNFLFLFQV